MTSEGHAAPSATSTIRADGSDSAVRVLKGAVWQGTAQLLAGVAGFAMVAWLARVLTPSSLGMWQLSVAIGTYLAIGSVLGVNQIATVRRAASDHGEGPLIQAWAGVRVPLAILVSLVWAASVVVLLRPSEADLPLVLLVPIAAVARTLWPDWLLQARRNGKLLAVLTASYPGALLVGIVVGTRNSGDTAVVAAVTATVAIVGMPIWWAAAQPKRVDGLRGASSKGLSKDLARTGVQVGVAALVVQMVMNADVVLMGVLSTPSETAIYASAMTIAVFVNGLAAAFHVAVVPAMSRSIRRGSVRRLVASLLPMILVLATAATVGIVVLSTELVEFAFGPRYLASAEPLRILSIQLPLSAVSAFYGTYLIAANRGRAFLLVFATAAAFNVGTNVVVIPIYGPLGAAAVTAATSIVALVALVMASRLGVLWTRRDLGLAALAGTGVVVAVEAARSLGLFPRITLGVAATIPALLLAYRAAVERDPADAGVIR